jgi:hypothetical protein
MWREMVIRPYEQQVAYLPQAASLACDSALLTGGVGLTSAWVLSSGTIGYTQSWRWIARAEAIGAARAEVYLLG